MLCEGKKWNVGGGRESGHESGCKGGNASPTPVTEILHFTFLMQWNWFIFFRTIIKRFFLATEFLQRAKHKSKENTKCYSSKTENKLKVTHFI